jgi:WD40 repeat protein
MYFHLALLLLHSLIISSLCNAMNESDHHLSSDHQLTLIRSFSTEQKILGVGFPTNDTVLTINHYGWSTYCSKTGEQKINSKNKQHITDFDLSKDGKIALADHYNVTVHNIETGDIIYTKTTLYGFKKVTFCANNNTLGVYNYTRGSITVHTIEKDEVKQYTTSYCVNPDLFAGNPTNKEFIIGNMIERWLTDNENTTITAIPGVANNMLSSSYNPDGTVIAIKCKDGYLFHKKDSQDFVINSSKNSGKSNGDIPYYSIAFHPKKRCAALLTNDNRIEFWDYTKKTEKPLAIIELPSKNKQRPCWYNDRDRLTAFAPNGKILATTDYSDIFYTVLTPEAAYYDDATKAQCVAFNWAIKNHPDLPFIPQDIITLIMHKLSRIPDFQLPK